jgi:putative flavoprotein involved in K+ transport
MRDLMGAPNVVSRTSTRGDDMSIAAQAVREIQPREGGAESLETIVIGGGQAGLSVGYYLAKRGRSFVILDAHQRIGDAWRLRWDSLLLFTPARMNGLPGMRFPAAGDRFINKDEMADYLETYAAKFKLPVRTGVKVERLSREGKRFVVSAGDLTFEADNVVVAMASTQAPWVPPFAEDLDPSIVQLHSKEYRNISQLQEGPVLIVGAGNSGADIAMEVARHHPTWMAGKESGHIPFRIEKWVARHIGVRLVRFVGHHVLTVRTPIGRKLRPKLLAHAAPLVRVKPKDLAAAGVTRVPRIVGVKDGLPMTADEKSLDVANVIWCTGFRPGFSWIDLPILGDRQEPAHKMGVAIGEPGLFFVGLDFLYSMSSETITGMQRDARRIVRHLARERRGNAAASVPRLTQAQSA